MAMRGRSTRPWQKDVEHATRSFRRRRSRGALYILTSALLWLILGGIIGVFTFTLLPDGLRAPLESGQDKIAKLIGRSSGDSRARLIRSAIAR